MNTDHNENDKYGDQQFYNIKTDSVTDGEEMIYYPVEDDGKLLEKMKESQHQPQRLYEMMARLLMILPSKHLSWRLLASPGVS